MSRRVNVVRHRIMFIILLALGLGIANLAVPAPALGKPSEHPRADQVPLVPDAALKNMSIWCERPDPDSGETTRTALGRTGSFVGDDTTLWAGSVPDDGLVHFDGTEGHEFSFACASDADDQSIPDDDEFRNSLDVHAPNIVYVKLDEAYHDKRRDGSEVTFTTGEIVRVSVERDAVPPEISDISVLQSSGEPLGIDEIIRSDTDIRTIPVGDSFKVSARIEDAIPDEETGSHSVSGIDPKSVLLKIGTIEITGSRAEDPGSDIYTFVVDIEAMDDAPDVAHALVDLSESHIQVSDVGGNVSKSDALETLDIFRRNVRQPDPAHDFNAIELLDTSEDSRPDVSILAGKEPISGKPDPQQHAYFTNDPAPSLHLRVTDHNFDQRDLWGSLADRDHHGLAFQIAYQVDGGAPITLDPAQFTAIGESARAVYQLDIRLKGPHDSDLPEGRHIITFTYTGIWPLPTAAEKLSATACIIADRTAPEICALTTPGYNSDTDLADQPAFDGAQPGYSVLIRPDGTLQITVRDLPDVAGSVTANSGIRSISATAQHHGTPDCTDSPTGASVDVGVSAPDGETTITLIGNGVYLLSDIQLTAEDNAGNKTQMSLSDLAASRPDTDSPFPSDRILVAKQDPDSGSEPYEVSQSITLLSNARNAEVAGGGEMAYSGDAAARISVRDIWFPVFSRTQAFKNVVTAKHKGAGEQDSIAGPDDPPHFTNVLDEDEHPTDEYTTDLIWPGDGKKMPDGAYDVRLAYRDGRGLEPETLDYVIDTTAPQITAACLVQPVDPIRDISRVRDIGDIAVGPARELRIRIQDLLPRSAGDPAPSQDTPMNEAGTAGVDAAGARAEITRWLKLHGDPRIQPDAPLVFDGSGWTTIHLADEGVYHLDGISFTASDILGNGANEPSSMADVIRSMPEELRTRWSFNAILVDDPATAPVPRIDVTDAADTPSSKDPHYHRGDTLVIASVEDRWFEAYQGLRSAPRDFFHGWYRVSAGSAPTELVPLAAADFKNLPGTDRWSAVFILPRETGDEQARPAQGEYDLHLLYRSLAGQLCPAQASFGVDYTPPVFGSLSLSQTAPEQWGWTFAPAGENVTLQVQDNLSGVAGGTAKVIAVGNIAPAPSFTPAASGPSGSVSFSFGHDGDRMLFEGTHVIIEDAAGNAADSGSFSDRCGTDLSRRAVGIMVDLDAPKMNVSYDNNDVQNGVYYRAARTASLTIDEPTLDIIRQHDAYRDIVTLTCDGVPTTVRAKDFENPSGDTRTWIAAIGFDRDGDWSWSASLTDPNGRPARYGPDAFTVDATAPRISVEFDNDDASNGMYFNAPRTATITVDDRNFSPDLASVGVWSRDASGAAAAAPGISGWKETKSRATWQTTVGFSAEQHFGFTVGCTDLAGNSADGYEEPEFVIDLTPPEVSIGGVQNAHAYADAVEPVIDYGDTNFDPLMATYTLTGARKGDVYMTSEETEAPGGKHVSYPDFEHILENDDVYTLTAEVTDLAGNTANQKVTFSVNRFGSTYMFTDPDHDIRGRFLDSPEEVSITEINVSGLKVPQTHVELAHDARVRPLAPTRDFSLTPNVDSNAWSATIYDLPASLFGTDGYYRILLTSQDRAGNLSQNSMDAKDSKRAGTFNVGFAVDTAPPVVDLVGLDSGGVYLDPVKKSIVDVHDAMELDSVTFSVDGEQTASWKASDFQGAPPEQPLVVDGRPHTYVLRATDRAGNTARATYADVVIAADWFTYILNTPRLLFGTTAGAIALVALAAAVVALAIRHRRRLRALRERIGGSDIWSPALSKGGGAEKKGQCYGRSNQDHPGSDAFSRRRVPRRG